MTYEVREIYEHELQNALDFARSMFDVQIAHSLDAQDRDEFFKRTDLANVYEKLKDGRLYLYGGFSSGVLVAVAAISPSGKIDFFLIESTYQNSGIELDLFDSLKYRCSMVFCISELYADVPQVLIPMYQFLGFQLSGETETQIHSRYAKMRYEVPMQYSYSAVPGPDFAQKDRKREYTLLAIIITTVIVVAIVAVFLGVRIFNGLLDYADQRSEIPYSDPYDEYNQNDDNFWDDEFDDQAEEETFSMNEYIADDLPFSVRKEVWELNEDTEEGLTNFYIEYPVLEGMADEAVQEKINEVLLACAMAQRDSMYPEISEDIRDLIDDNKYWRESVVEYKISYLDENVMSVAFFDHYFLGSVFAEFNDMRTRTFDLRTGERYELEDLLFPNGEVGDHFIDDFRERMIAEAPDSEVFKDEKVMSNDTIRRILLGEIVDNRYYCSFFITEQGIEMCVTYHFRSSDENIIARGWITTHYNYNELVPYEKTNDLWDVLPR